MPIATKACSYVARVMAQLPQMENFPLPLPERSHDVRVRKEGASKAIAAYAAEVAGTELDLDPNLESAAIELMMTDRET
jgi:hypothetical protein